MTKLENLKAKLQESKKFRTQFASVLVAGVVVVGCAVAIPIGVHAQGVKKATAAQEAVSAHESLTAEQVLTEPQATEPTTEAPTETIPETTATAAVTENTTVKKSASENSGSSGSAKKSGSSSKSSSGKSSGSKSTATTAPQRDWCDYTQAEVNAIIAECRAYAESLGFVWHDSLTKENSSWASPAVTLDYSKPQELTADMKDAIDRNAENSYWGDPEFPPGLKIIAERVENPAGGDGSHFNPYYWWEFYLMY